MSDSEDVFNYMFQEPADYYKPEPEATYASHTLLSGRQLKVRLVGHNPLWGHLLWNAGRTISDYLEERASDLIEHRYVLELGAGAGLPSLVCAINGAARVVVTDYPDSDLVENLNYNIAHCSQLSEPHNVFAEGHLWGAPVDKLLAHLPPDRTAKGFDVLILADLLFNHTEHRKLIQTVQQTLEHQPDARALVFFTPYRPWLLEKDLAFFDLAQSSGFHVHKILEKTMDEVLFENDPGDELLRRTVFGYELKWNDAPNPAVVDPPS